jgi:RimJ/RimL family protein N-acetyltransferase
MEGILRDHLWRNGHYTDVLIHGMLREDYEQSHPL